jgi:hypothetical protein
MKSGPSPGGKKSIMGHFFRVEELLFGATRVQNDQYVAIPFPAYTPFRGIIGVDFFLHYVVRVDFDRRVVTALRQSQFHYSGTGTPLHLELDKETGLPHIQASVEGHPGTFVLDTGNERGLILNAPFVREFHLGEGRKVISSSDIRTVTGLSPASETRLSSFQIGPLTVDGQVAVLLRSESDGDPGVSGNIGIPELSRFNPTFDFARNVVYIEKNRNFDVRAEDPRSGIVRDRSQPGYVVLSVLPGSPADVTGLKPGDRIVQIDGTPIARLDATAISDKFFAPAGTILALTIQRKGATKIVILTLRDLL